MGISDWLDKITGNSKPPVISVIMNCYNSEKYLYEAITSVLDQSFPNWEIIFWDNQSTDNSASIVKGIDDKRVRYFYAPLHTDLAEARNHAVREAKGEWIAFLDCDDIWLPEKVEKQIKRIEDHGDNTPGIVYCRTNVLREDGSEIPFLFHPKDEPLREGWIIKDLLGVGNFIPFVSCLVKREAYWNVGGIPQQYTYGEDYYLLAAIAENHITLAVQDMCCLYRQHSGNMSAVPRSEIWLEAIWILDKWSHHLPPDVVEKKRREYRTLEGICMIKSGSVAKGISNILKNGSLGYLAAEFSRKFAK
ncbi:MAG: glycosyltransferase family 2 protein [Candidatus Lindowbacteria bacterium]|nr:glycosyltransferase family 2 protein [Candidatus Lindowbacteria bacterium]